MTLPRMAKRILAATLFLLGLAVSLMASLFAAYQAAKIMPQVAGLISVVLLVCFLGILLSAFLSGKVIRSFLNRSLLLTSGAGTVLIAVALYFAVLRPIHYLHYAPVPRANTQYWDLSTGSRIAYSVYDPPAGVPIKPEPIVFVHGGPGIRALDTDHAFYRQFTADGFRVYLFDQAGSGLSAQLPNASAYTVERFVADLEAIRHQINVDRLILIGHSWGGTLIAHYAAAYPNHVAKMIFHSPGGIWDWSAPMQVQRTAQGKTSLPPTRIMAALLLSRINLTATQNLISQQELGDWMATANDPGQLVCRGQRYKVPASLTPASLSGTNAYPLLVAQHELSDSKMDIRSQLNNVHAPAIMLTSQCDFVPWSEQVPYENSIPGLSTYYFPDSGHYINFSQPEKLTALLRSFLLDQPPPFAPYQGKSDPRPPLNP
jgi:proline-specific peptidase